MGGSSSSDQTSEGDLVFNNVNQSAGRGPSPLKNFNVGRGNSLKNNSFNVSVTDRGAIRNALNAVGRVASNTNAQSGRTARQAIESGRRTADNAIFAVREANSDSLASNERVTGDAINANQAVTRDAIDANQAVTREAIDGAQAQSELVADISEGAQDSVFDLAETSLGTFENVANDAGQLVAQAQEASERATTNALDTVFQTTQSEQERSTQDLFQFGIAALAVVAVAAFIRG